MKMWSEARSWMRSLLRRESVESEMDAELRFHMERRAEDLRREAMARGESIADKEALRRAQLEFGGMDRAKEECREARGASWLENLTQDLRYGVRMLRKNPVSTLAVVVALALGIGLNTTVFTFVNALLLRPPALVEDVDRLKEVWLHNRAEPGAEGYMPISYPDYLYYRDHNQSFSGVLAFDGDPEAITWNEAGEGQMILGQIVSGNYFSVLGVHAAMGRTISEDDDRAGNDRPAVFISHRFWQERLGSDPKIVGRGLVLNGLPVTVVGVAPAGFTGLIAVLEPDVWAPLSMTGLMTRQPDRLENRHTSWLIVAGRLKPDVSEETAHADLRVLGAQIEKNIPEAQTKTEPALFAATMMPGPYRKYVAAFTGVLMAAFVLLLLIACVNAAGLLLARAAARSREMAIRSALGAGRWRLVRQMLAESVLLSVIAGAAGLAVAVWCGSLLMKLVPSSLPIKVHAGIDWRVLLFTLAISLAAGIVFGLTPALSSTGAAVAPALKEGVQKETKKNSRLRAMLMTCQIAACVTLAIGAALCVESLGNAGSIDTGFDAQHTAAASFDPHRMGYSDAKVREFYDRLAAKVTAIPGVTSVSYVHHLPLGGARESRDVLAGNRAPDERNGKSVDAYRVAPDFFRTMSIPILRGRDFSRQESVDEANVAVVNAAMAKLLFGDSDPVGQHITFGGNGESTLVIGVVKTGKYRTLGEDPIPVVYLPSQGTQRTLVVHTAGDPKTVLETIREQAREVDPAMAPMDLETMQQYMTFPLFPARAAGLLIGAAGLLAMIITSVGLFGVISYIVSQRTHEIGLRMALGARPANVLRLVAGHGLVVTTVGLALGLAAAFAGTRLLQALLYGVKPNDPATLIGVALTVTAVVLAACYLPARRAMKVDPLVALRNE